MIEQVVEQVVEQVFEQVVKQVAEQVVEHVLTSLDMVPSNSDFAPFVMGYQLQRMAKAI